MRRPFLIIGGAILAASAFFAVGACGNDYESTGDGPAQGSLDGACYPNSTCDDALTCVVVGGQAKCRPSGTASDASSDGNAPNASDAGDAGDATDASKVPDAQPGECAFQPFPFECGGPTPVSCFGSAVTCTDNACPVGLLRWECTAQRQCDKETDQVCCLTAKDVIPMEVGCSAGGADVNSSVTKCQQDCDSDAWRLCESTADCKAGFHCRPVKVVKGPSSLQGATLGVCAPQ